MTTTPRTALRHRLRSASIGAIALTLAQLAGADGSDSAKVPLLPLYRQECGSCHVAYPPGLLPSTSWQRQLGTLNRHYGTDASLDPKTVQQLSAWLTPHAARDGRRSMAPPEDRITRSPWFVREHDELDPGVWKLAGVKSAANCAACHTRADDGSYRERELVAPAGLPARYLHAFVD